MSGVRTPILMLTARTQEAEKVLALELGADDYMTKPFGVRELRARIMALQRRTRAAPAPDLLVLGDVQVDFGRAEVRRGSVVTELTAIEFRLLEVFVRSRGLVLTRQQLIDGAWGDNAFVSDRVVDNHIGNLRKKLEPDASEPRFLRNIRGLGYRFDADPALKPDTNLTLSPAAGSHCGGNLNNHGSAN